jgi:hypothetical protein
MHNDFASDWDAVEFLRCNAPQVLETLSAVLVAHRASTISLVMKHEFAQSTSTTLHRAVVAAAREIERTRSGGAT